MYFVPIPDIGAGLSVFINICHSLITMFARGRELLDISSLSKLENERMGIGFGVDSQQSMPHMFVRGAGRKDVFAFS